ncbi:MAG: glycosyltransferase [Bacillaceae bacterium]
MKKLMLIFCSVFLLSNLALTPSRTFGMHTSPICNPQTTHLKMLERKLWSDHVLWTRNFIISDLADLGDKDAVAKRLLQNQDEIGNSIKPYYGQKAGDMLAKLLREHILLAVDVVNAAKKNDKAALDKSNKLWYKNADDIAKFLSKANPNWPYETMKAMLFTHLKLLTDQVVARINKDWNADIVAYDKGENHILMLADLLSNGIIKQFPEKFK